MNLRSVGQFWALLCSLLLLSISASAKNVTVQISNSGDSLQFFPSSVTINVGDSITWNWNANNHSTTSGSCTTGSCTPDNKWDSGIQNAPHTFTQTFNSAGTFPYYCRVHGAMFGMRGTVNVVKPDYSIIISNPSAGPIFPNQTATFSGLLSTQTGFSNSVLLNCGAGAPGTCLLNPPSAVPSSGGTPFTITAGSSTATTFQFAVQGVGTDTSHTPHNSQTLKLTVVDFDFSALADMTVSSNATSVPQQFSANGFNGFTGAVNFSCSGLPASASCGFSSNPANLSAASPMANVDLTITTVHTLQGTYPITVSATTSSIPNAPIKMHTFNLNVQADYQVSVSNSAIQVFPGQSSAFNGTISPLDGYTGTVTITCGPYDATITCTAPAPIAVTNANPVPFNVNFTTSNGGATAPADYSKNIVATDANNLSHSQPSTVRVVDFTLNGPPSISAIQGNPSSPGAISISALGNWNPVVSLDVSGLPAGSGFVFSPNATATSSRSATLVINSGTAPTGASNLTVTGSVLGAQRTAQIPLTISAGAGSTDLGVTMSHTITAPVKAADPAPVGGTVEFTAAVSNSGGAPANPVLFVSFSEPVTFASSLPTGCAPLAGGVSCTISTLPASLNFDVVAPFTRSLTAQAFVRSDTPDSTPANNTSSPETVQIRPRPLSRDGLPPKLP